MALMALIDLPRGASEREEEIFTLFLNGSQASIPSCAILILVKVGISRNQVR